MKKKKTKKRIPFYQVPSLRIIFIYSTVVVFFGILSSTLIPFLLNYGPESINTEFDKEMSYIYYWQQYALIIAVVLLFLFISLRHVLKEVDLWYASRRKR